MKNKSYCRNCGNELNPGDTFCAGCGSAVKSEETQATQQVFVNSIDTAAKKKMSNKMIGIIICAFVVLVAIIGIIVAVCVNNSDASELLGTWKDPSDGKVVGAFNDNGIMYWDNYIMNYEITENGEITVSSVMRCSDIYNVEEFLEYSAEDYMSDQLKKHSYDDEDNEEILYYKLVKGDMYDRLYMEDARDELEERIMDDEYLTRVK